MFFQSRRNPEGSREYELFSRRLLATLGPNNTDGNPKRDGRGRLLSWQGHTNAGDVPVILALTRMSKQSVQVVASCLAHVRLRVDAPHSRVIRDAVNREHVSGRP